MDVSSEASQSKTNLRSFNLLTLRFFLISPKYRSLIASDSLSLSFEISFSSRASFRSLSRSRTLKSNRYYYLEYELYTQIHLSLSIKIPHFFTSRFRICFSSKFSTPFAFFILFPSHFIHLFLTFPYSFSCSFFFC